MSAAWIVASIVTAAWLLVALFQLGDVATAFLDSRTARDRDVPGRIARERTNELFWVLPVALLVALVIGIGIDQAGRYFVPGHGYSLDGLALAALFLLGLAVVVIGIATLALAAVAATDPISYSALRRELRDYEGERITPKQFDSFKSRLARIDRRTRSRMQPRQVLLTTPSIVRLATVVLGLGVIAACWVAQATSPSVATEPLVYVAILAPVLSALFAVLGIR
ncbi:MAG TPA: hypothetical protein VHZ98_08315, partial [Galbitalea sp.]|nr:hypothetical protein [Galbitalea sp.]